MIEKTTNTEETIPPIFVVSGGVGTAGEQLVRTALAQFEDVEVPLKVFAYVDNVKQLEQVIAKAAEVNGTIVHTIYQPGLFSILINLAKKNNVVVIDLINPLLERLTDILGQEPIGKPGLYRELHKSYFRQLEAIEFTVSYDDGVNYQNWREAEIVIAGVSRVGKTPLSLYLSMLGWKIANVPIVMGVPPQPELFELDHRRVIGLTIDPAQLLLQRQYRQKHLGTRGPSDYVDLENLYSEIEAARRVFRQGGFRVVDVTNQPIEASASRIVTLITQRLGDEAHRELEHF
jgi:hypothetical protein